MTNNLISDIFTVEEREGNKMSPDYGIIGKRIKNLRIEKKMKQEQLADKLDISVAYMSRIERGNGKINLKRLIQISEILKVSPSYLLTGSNVASKDYLKQDFYQVLEKCTPEQQKLIYQISELVSKTNILKKD